MKIASRFLASAGALALSSYPSSAVEYRPPAPKIGTTAGTIASGINPRIVGAVQGGGLADALTFYGRSVASRFKPSISPMDAPYNAKGDGVSDDTLALKSWAAALGQGGPNGTAAGELPCNNFYFTSTVSFGFNVHVRGHGACSSLTYAGTGAALLMSNVGNVTLEHFVVLRNTPDLSGIGVHVQNDTSINLDDLIVKNFYRGISVEGGDSTIIRHPFIRNGSLYTASTSGMVSTGPASAHPTYLPGSASIYVGPYAYIANGVTGYACPNSLTVDDQNIGGENGSDGSAYTTEAGILLACVDGFYTNGAGHVGAVQNDFEIARRADLNAQSIELGGYYDGAVRHLYVPAPSAAPSGVTASGGSAHVRFKPFVAENSLGNSVENQDPKADIAIQGVDFADDAGWGVLAPVGAKIEVSTSKFDYVGFGSGLNAGGVRVGLTASGAAGSVAAAFVMANQFYGTTNCIAAANMAESLIRANQTKDCTSGKQPAEIFPGGITTANMNADGTALIVGGALTAPSFTSNQPGTVGPQIDTSGATQITLAQGATQQLPANLSGLLILTYYGSGTSGMMMVGGKQVYALPSNSQFTATNTTTTHRGRIGLYYDSKAGRYTLYNNLGQSGTIGVAAWRTRSLN